MTVSGDQQDSIPGGNSKEGDKSNNGWNANDLGGKLDGHHSTNQSQRQVQQDYTCKFSALKFLKKEGLSLKERIINGSADRLNPILMTALASALALIPLALSGDKPGNEIQSPMAIVILGGLVTSTLLNLIVIPSVYYILEKRK